MGGLSCGGVGGAQTAGCGCGCAVEGGRGGVGWGGARGGLSCGCGRRGAMGALSCGGEVDHVVFHPLAGAHLEDVAALARAVASDIGDKLEGF